MLLILSMKINKLYYSPSAILVVLLMIIIVVTYNWRPFSNVLAWDVFGYYLYLPSLFIYHDYGFHDLNWLQQIVSVYHNTDPICQLTSLKNGNAVPAYSMGLAILYSPAFFLAHGYALLSGGKADGFSMPYQTCMLVCAQFVTFFGLWFLRKILRSFFSETISCIAIVLLVLGTNYFHTAVYGGNMPHNTLFTLLMILTWSTIQWEKEAKPFYIILVGLCGGFITLIRPTEIIVFLIPLLWGVRGIDTAKVRLQLFIKYKRQLLLFFIAIFAVGLPQLIYWKIVAGSFLYYVQPDGVGLFFDSPHIQEVLFGFRKGWFVYTPLMIFCWIGLFWLWKRQRNLVLPLLIYLIANVYIISSWSCWWYGGGDFSQRAMVSSYGILMIPLGFFLQDIYRKAIFFPVMVVFLLLIMLNLFQTWQFHNGILSGDRMTKKSYCQIFGKTSMDPRNDRYLLVDRSKYKHEPKIDKEAYTKEIMLFLNFDKVEKKDSDCYIVDNSFGGTHSYQMDGDHQFSPGSDFSFKEMSKGEYAFVHASVYVFIPEGYSEEPPLLSSNFLHGKRSFFYIDKTINPDSLRYNPWNFMEITFITPEVVSQSDKLYINVWHRGKSPIRIDQFSVEVYRPNPID